MHRKDEHYYGNRIKELEETIYYLKKTIEQRDGIIEKQRELIIKQEEEIAQLKTIVERGNALIKRFKSFSDKVGHFLTDELLADEKVKVYEKL